MTESLPPSMQILERAQVAVRIGDTIELGECLEAIDGLLATSQNSARHYVRGRVLVWLERHDEAVRALATAVQLDPKNAHALFTMGLLYARANQHVDALRCWAGAAAVDPSFDDAWFNWGQAAYNLGVFDQALHAFDALITRHPRDPVFQRKRIQVLHGAGRHDDAGTATRQLAAQLQEAGDTAQVVVDQLQAGSERVLVRQTLPALASSWLYQFEVPGARPIELWQRDVDGTSTFGLVRPGTDAADVLEVYTELPSYAALRRRVTAIVSAPTSFAGPTSAGPTGSRQ